MPDRHPRPAPPSPRSDAANERVDAPDVSERAAAPPAMTPAERRAAGEAAVKAARAAEQAHRHERSSEAPPDHHDQLRRDDDLLREVAQLRAELASVRLQAEHAVRPAEKAVEGNRPTTAHGQGEAAPAAQPLARAPSAAELVAEAVAEAAAENAASAANDVAGPARGTWSQPTKSYPSSRYASKNRRGETISAYQQFNPPYPYVTDDANHAAFAAYHLASLSADHGGHRSLRRPKSAIGARPRNPPSRAAMAATAAYESALAHVAEAHKRSLDVHAISYNSRVQSGPPPPAVGTHHPRGHGPTRGEGNTDRDGQTAGAAIRAPGRPLASLASVTLYPRGAPRV